MGNCGVGFAPAAPERHEWLIELMEGVEDIPGAAMAEGITWEWEHFREYLDALERRPHVIDFGAQIAHGAAAGLRDGRARRRQRAGHRRRHRRDVRRSSRRRCGPARSGSRTSRTPIHRSKSGELVPGTDAAADELYGIADALRRAGHGVFQFAPDHALVPGRRVAVDARAGPPHRPDGEHQPQPARPGARGVARRAAACSTRPTPTACRSSPRSPVARRAAGLPRGEPAPALFHPAYQEIADLPLRPAWWRRCASRSAGGASSRTCPTTAGCFQRGRARQARPLLAGGRRRHRLRAGGRRHRWPPGPPAPACAPMELVLDQLSPTTATACCSRRSSTTPTATCRSPTTPTSTRTPAWAWPTPGPTAGSICDGGTPTFMLTFWTRDRTRGPKLAARARRAPPDPPDGRALRPARPGAAWRPGCGPT